MVISKNLYVEEKSYKITQSKTLTRLKSATNKYHLNRAIE